MTKDEREALRRYAGACQQHAVAARHGLEGHVLRLLDYVDELEQRLKGVGVEEYLTAAAEVSRLRGRVSALERELDEARDRLARAAMPRPNY